MKSIVNFNFISVMIVALLLIIFGIVMNFVLTNMDKNFNEVESSITDTCEDGEVEDVEGYGAILTGISYSIGAIGLLFIRIVSVIIPIIISFLISLFTIIARCVYKGKSKRLLAYRILTGFSLANAIILAGLYDLYFVVYAESIILKAMFLLFFIYIIVTSILVIRNTYSSRIKECEALTDIKQEI